VAFIPVMVVTAGITLVPLRRFRFALPAVTVAIALTALIQMALQPYPAEPLLDAFTVSSKELLSRNHCWALTEFLNRLVPSNGRVLSFWENRLYFLDRPFIADSVWGAPSSLARLREVGDAHAFAEKIAAEGVTHVVVNPELYDIYMTNGFTFDVVDKTLYPAERLRAVRSGYIGDTTFRVHG
jgi:hypothetical protein